MKKEVLIHLSTFLIFFLIFSFFKGFFNFSSIFFWLGGFIGTIIPDIDHLIYVYFLRPKDLSSQRIQYTASRGEFLRTWSLLAVTRSERTHLIFHTAWFQVVFILFSFLVITSSNNLFGRGLVLAFLIHLAVDAFIDFVTTGAVLNWIRQIPFVFDKTQTFIYLLANFGIILLFGILI